MAWEEYSGQAFFAQQPLHARIMDLCAAYARGDYAGFRAGKLRSGVSRQREDLLLWGGGGGGGGDAEEREPGAAGQVAAPAGQEQQQPQQPQRGAGQ
jgi:hypothetical protein